MMGFSGGARKALSTKLADERLLPRACFDVSVSFFGGSGVMLTVNNDEA